MRLPENLHDMADAEFSIGSPEMIQAGYDQAVDEHFILEITENNQTAAQWFHSLEESGKKNVISYLQNRHGCYTKFSQPF